MPGLSHVKCFQQNTATITSGNECMQLFISVLVKSCGMAWFNLLVNNSFFFLLLLLFIFFFW